MYVVIRAGGVGTRLWPVSRNAKPKQFHALTSQKTLLQEAIDRVLDITTPEKIFVSCNSQTETVLRSELGAILEHNIIVEPALRDTAAAVGLEAITIAQHDPKAVIASLGSDQSITDVPAFQHALQLAEKTIQQHPDRIICVGVKPTQPDTGYGYIELGEQQANEIYAVKSFKEKPDDATAREFIKAGNYLWNGNMFVWRVDTLLKLYQQHMPIMYQTLIEIQKNPDSLGTLYPQLEKVAVDYAILEKTPGMLAIPGQFGWNDIGDWARLKDELTSIETDNYSKGDHLDMGSKNTLVYSETDRFIATINTTNLIIVDTPDGLLVCDKFSSQMVKELVAELKKRGRDNLL